MTKQNLYRKSFESKAEFIIEDGKIIDIKFKDVKGKRSLSHGELKEFKNFVGKFKEDIVQKWIDHFILHKTIPCIKIERRVK